MKSTRVLACIVTLILCVSVFAGCSNPTQTPDSSTAASSAATSGISVFDGEITVKGGPYKVALSNFSVGNSWRVQMVAEFENACEQLKTAGAISQYFVTNADGDIAKQISDVRDMITKDVDMIVITCASGSALTDVCDEAMAEGIKVVSFDNYLEYDDGQVQETARIGVDQVEFGKIGGAWLAEALEGIGNIIVLNGMAGTLGSEQRWNGAKAELDKFPDIKVLGIGYGDWDYAKGKVAAEQLIDAYGDQIDGVYSQGGAMTQGAIDAFNERGMELVPMTGEANNGMLKAWKANVDKGFSSIAPDAPSYVSVEALKLALRACEDEDVSGFHAFDFQMVTDANLDQYVNADLPDSFWVFTHLTTEQVKALFSK
ncbi:MAG: substrate-binding domain-containing protein [Saccharofermentanales bacterium]